MIHAFNLNTQQYLCEFKAIMVYTAGYGTARTTLRESSFNKPKAKPKELKMIVEFIFENKGKNETSDLWNLVT